MYTSYFFRSLKQKRQAFSLAEVLITLVIIGVVSTLVLPTVINKVQGYANKRAHMVFQSKFKTAVQLMQGSNALTGYQTTEQFVEQFKKYIKIAKICDNMHLTECFPPSLIDATGKEVPTENMLTLQDLYGINLNGALNTNVNGIILQDGTNILIAYNTNCTIPATSSTTVNMDCFSMVYDINGGTTNKLGSTTSDFIVSLGEKEDNSNASTIKDIGKINAPQYGTPVRFNGSTTTCTAIGGTVFGGNCEVFGNVGGDWYSSKSFCEEKGLTLPTNAELIAFSGGARPYVV